jgi:hypothetical protein
VGSVPWEVVASVRIRSVSLNFIVSAVMFITSRRFLSFGVPDPKFWVSFRSVFQARNKTKLVEGPDNSAADVELPPLPAMPGGVSISVVIAVPVISQQYKGKPPGVASITLRRLATDIYLCPPQVTNRVGELFAVVAQENRCKINPGHVCPA